MVGLDWICGRIDCRIGEWRVIEDQRRQRDSPGDDESFDTEAALEVLKGRRRVAGFDFP